MKNFKILSKKTLINMTNDEIKMYSKILSESYSDDEDLMELHLELRSLKKHFLQFDIKEEIFELKMLQYFIDSVLRKVFLNVAN